MNESTPTTSRSANYSISPIIPFVNNKDVLRYLPDDMLNNEQKKAKWEAIAEGKPLGELFYENDADMSQCLDVEFNKKNRVTAAQFASSEAIASTLRSPQFNSSIHDSSQKNNTFDKNKSKNVSDERKSVKRIYEVDSTGEESELEKDTTLFLWLATEYKRSQYCKN